MYCEITCDESRLVNSWWDVIKQNTDDDVIKWNLIYQLIFDVII